MIIIDHYCDQACFLKSKSIPVRCYTTDSKYQKALGGGKLWGVVAH